MFVSTVKNDNTGELTKNDNTGELTNTIVEIVGVLITLFLSIQS